MKKRILLPIGSILISYALIDYSSRILPVNPQLTAPFKVHTTPNNTGLKSDDWSFWGASGIKAEDGKYHVFASRMSNHCGLETWDFNSEVVRATSSNPLGPYEVQQVVLPAMAHNPVIKRDESGRYYLFYIGRELDKSEQINSCSAGTTNHMPVEKKKHPTEWTCSINVRNATSLMGPWSDEQQLMSGAGYPFCSTNPSPVFNKDGSVDLYYRAYRYVVTDDKSDKSRYHPYPQEWLYKATGTSPVGPFTRFNPIPVLQAQGEDAYVWDDEKGRHMIFNNKFNNKIAMGGYAFAENKSDFLLGQPIYTHFIKWEGKTTEKVARRERPQIMWLEDGKGILFQGIRTEKKNDKTYTLATPIGNWTEAELNKSISN